MSKNDIYELLQKYYNGNCSGEEMERLNRYLADNKADEGFLIRVMNELLEDARSDHDYDKESVLLNIKNELDLQKDKPVASLAAARFKHKPEFNKNVKFLVAAFLSIVIVAGFLAYNQSAKTAGSEECMTCNWQEITTGRGQFSTINLPDGSTIRLNVASKIRFRENFLEQSERKVYLEGEAYFDVAGMPEKPFVIESMGFETRVVGTSFNISAYPNQAQVCVSVVSGKVTVGTVKNRESVRLVPDEMAIWDQRRIEKSSYDRELVLGWASQTLIFKNAGFEEVIKRLEDWYDVDFTIHGQINSNDYTARHKAEPLEVILKGLSFAGNFTFNIKGKEVIIHANSD